ncbi:hypothetical protein [Pseudomonas sp. CCC4.4]|uniref:hypothetical protein n=1 Tax=Pseudomonas sp. CCC4.4 TaxID=3048612 RepID=UPI002B23047F|nr:hypothetical protein [Pseudomonas sp. CCC4.4]MEB0170037.1 hypothetical protein [Pseudomonas sp. CCC4.4]
MSDYAKLKAFAGAASRGEWSTSHDTIFAIQEGQTKRLMETEEGSDIAWIEHRLNLRFIAAADPAVVLGLIAERSVALWQLDIQRDIAARRHEQIDQLKAEIERQAAQFKEWQAGHHANYVSMADERDALKAECEGLRRKVRIQQRLNESAESIRKDAGGQS